MYWNDYMWFLAAMLLCMVFSGIASSKVKSSFEKYNKSSCRSGMTGYDTVYRLMKSQGIYDISIGSVSGFLTDHYHPNKRVVNLSQSTYSNSSVAAVAVAAHEVGHVMQRRDGYFMYRVRTALVPIVNFSSRLAMPLVLLGLLLNFFVELADPNTGFYIAMVGVVLYGGSLLFALVTLPVELNASKRAREMLLSQGILSEDEIPGAREVLSAAALTYLASLLASLVSFLRFLVYVLSIFGRRNNNR
ncbi:MAG: zinc metallopeptidase [Clostridiales bacterium]|nr:zinc metallopeptidase [Clostridiales bacterium]